MNKFVKGCLMFSVICLLLGGLLLGIGTMMGARPYQYMNLARIGNKNNSFLFWRNPFRDTRDLQDDLEDLTDDLEDLADLDVFDDWDDWEDWENMDDSEIEEFLREDDHWHHRGEAGSHIKDSSLTGCLDETFSQEEIEKLNIQIAYGEIYIYPHDGEGIRVRASNCGRTFQCWQEDEKLRIEDNRKKRAGSLIMELYVPEKELAALDLDLGAGRLYAEKLTAREAELDLGAGICEIQSLQAREKAEVGIGTGQFVLGSFEGRKLDGSCGAGEMQLNIAGNYEEYDYDISCGIGVIVLNGHRYSGLGVENSIDNHGDKKIWLDCGVGDLQVTFSED
ncbi:MAG: hypothetical protein HFI31_07250 [Lachnospiraceae bacterium]|jgi:hypothetical protein|nr:hypothetical protein [Lachnospiraceae bacterium]MCI9133966.1 hypothetical protein [Lachnospiraceae bacterium]